MNFRRCGSCGSEHLGPDCHMTFRERLLSVRLGEGTMETRTKVAYYNTEVVQHQFSGQDRKERRERFMDATQGFGAAETQPDGSIWGTDPKTKEKRELTLDEVNRVYLTGGTGE